MSDPSRSSPGELCVDRGRLVVLDWEYAAIGNPWFDAAALHRQLDIPAKQIATLPAWHAVTLTDFKAGLAWQFGLRKLWKFFGMKPG